MLDITFRVVGEKDNTGMSYKPEIRINSNSFYSVCMIETNVIQVNRKKEKKYPIKISTLFRLHFTDHKKKRKYLPLIRVLVITETWIQDTRT